jgi:hypothetical protein
MNGSSPAADRFTSAAAASTAVSDGRLPVPADRKVGILGRLRTSVLALVVANLVPVYGVLALGWKVAPIMVFYWTENLVVGVFNLVKMARAQGPVGDSHTTLNGKPVTQDSLKALMLFFAIHYGGFTLGHGVFVLVLFSPAMENILGQLGLALLFLSASHGLSYRRNFIGRGEYLRVSFVRLFWQPYVRIVVMHITILAGGVLAGAMGSPIGILLVLVGLKTLIDIGAHWLERRKFSKEPHA